MSDFVICVTRVLKNEGGFVIDVGGATNYGITAKYLMQAGKWQYDRDKDGTIGVRDMLLFTEGEAVIEYKKMFYDWQIDKLDSDKIATSVFDMCVNSGEYRGVMLLQRAYNTYLGRLMLLMDGLIGPKTRGAINDIVDVNMLYGIYCEKRAEYYISLAKANPIKYGQYLNGWLKRAKT